MTGPGPERGYIEVRLTLLGTDAGGRSQPIVSDYRPDWNIGNRSENGDEELNGAPIVLEGRAFLAPGATGTVRLYPWRPELWTRVTPGMEIAMHEGPRAVGTGVVVRVVLAVESR